jgi:hypothetical protein
MKYLYPYECEKEGLSTVSELQSAIEGNKRETRRSIEDYHHSSFSPFGPFSNFPPLFPNVSKFNFDHLRAPPILPHGAFMRPPQNPFLNHQNLASNANALAALEAIRNKTEMIKQVHRNYLAGHDNV